MLDTTDFIEDIVSGIQAVQADRQDTTMLDYYNGLMNQLTHAYGFHLVRCLDCATITECPTDDSIEVECPKCAIQFTSNEAPDLFF